MKASRIRPAAAALACFLLAGALAACTSSQPTPPPTSTSAMNVPLGGDPDLVLPPGGGLPGSQRGARTAPGQRAAPGDPAAARAAPRPTGPQVRVTWEALAVEKERFENPRFGRRPQAGLATCQRVVLVSKSHPEAQASMSGFQARQNRGVAVAAVPDRDMLLFVQGLKQRGFFGVAEPTSTLAHQFESPNARGRVTIERDGQSWTILSMRGQGLNPATKRIPRLYSESKQAVMVLRNQVATLGVVGVQGARLERD